MADHVGVADQCFFLLWFMWVLCLFEIMAELNPFFCFDSGERERLSFPLMFSSSSSFIIFLIFITFL